MQLHRAIALLLLVLVGSGGQLVLAEAMKTPPGALRPEAGCIRATAHWVPAGTPRIAVLPPVELADVPAHVPADLPATVPADVTPNAPANLPADLPADVTPETLPAPASLDAPGALTLDDLARMALASNPTLVQARMALQAAQGGYVQARLYPNPTIGYAGADLGIAGTAGQQGVFVAQEFVTAGKRRLETAVASCEIEQARCGLEAQQWRVLNDVRSGYYEVLLAQRTIDLNEELVRIGEEGVAVTEKLKAAMEVSQADVLQARIEADTANLGLYEARQRHQAAWRQLAAVLGRPEMEPQALAGELDREVPELTWDDTLRELLARSPELARARAAVRRARNDEALQWANRRPNFEVGLGFKYDDSDWRTLADVEFAVPLPLIDRNQGNIMRAQADLIAAEHEVRRLELELRDRLAEAFEQYANARHQVETYTQKILPNAQASLDLIAGGYREGEFGYLTLLTAQRTFFDVNLSYLANLKELWARSVELEGMLLGGGLEGPE